MTLEQIKSHNHGLEKLWSAYITKDSIEEKFVCTIPKSTLINPMFYTSFGVIIGNNRHFANCRFIEKDKLQRSLNAIYKSMICSAAVQTNSIYVGNCSM